MVKISPFSSLRPSKELVSKVPTKAYNQYSKKEIKKEKEKNKYSFLNIIDFKKEANLKTNYTIIKDKIDDFKSKNILQINDKKSFYIYQQSSEKNTFTGLICTVSLEDYKKNKIKIHEKTIEKREILFAKYLSITKIHAEPVLLTHNGQDCISETMMLEKNKIYDFKDVEGVNHKIWQIDQQNSIKKIIDIFAQINSLYIADGHHRMASSARNKRNQTCLAYILPKKQLKVYPFHRVLNSKINYQQLIHRISNIGEIKIIKEPEEHSKNIQFYTNKKWHIIIDHNPSYNLLVEKLMQNILTPIFKIHDERNNKQIRFIPGTQPIPFLLAKLKTNEIFFLMTTINLDTIINIANQHRTTPPKSTFILPKIPSGLIMMEL